MDMKKFIDIVRSADEDSILEMLFECYNAQNDLYNDRIRQDFEKLYEAMNGKTLREKDEVIYATCSLCRSHAEQGFIEGIRVGMRLAQEVGTVRE